MKMNIKEKIIKYPFFIFDSNKAMLMDSKTQNAKML